MSSALLPSDAVIVEIGNSWRHLKTLGFLGAWAVLGLVALDGADTPLFARVRTAKPVMGMRLVARFGAGELWFEPA